MARRILITSTSNDRLRAARRLARGRRRGDQMFLVEGHRQLKAALEAGAPVQEVFAAPQLFLGDKDERLVTLAERRGARVYELSEAAFRALSAHVRPDGLAALVERWPTPLAQLPPADEPLLAVAESIERPGNLGAIVRTACAAGASALVVCDPVTDVFHPDTVRGAAGTLFKLPVAVADGTAALSWLREHAVRVVVTTPAGARVHSHATAAGGVAAVFGSERHGVTRRWLAAADELVRIPMPGPVDSLNVAVASGIVLFELAGRR